MRNVLKVLVFSIVVGSVIGNSFQAANAYNLLMAGKIVSVSETEVVVETQDGKTEAFQITEKVKITDDNGKKIAITDFKPGDEVALEVGLESRELFMIKKGSSVDFSF